MYKNLLPSEKELNFNQTVSDRTNPFTRRSGQIILIPSRRKRKDKGIFITREILEPAIKTYFDNGGKITILRRRDEIQKEASGN